MTCAECESLSLADELLPEQAEALAEHLGGCARCRAEAAQTRAVLELAALPPVSAGERAQLTSLAASTLGAWRGAERRRSSWRRVADIAVAAAIGGLIASAALLGREAPSPAPRAGATELGASAFDESWPLEGDLLAADPELDALTYEVPWSEEAETPEGDTP